jgi:NAD(P)-dependent dehydrogenase (short-subunit alcohol dehydrogenase family)
MNIGSLDDLFTGIRTIVDNLAQLNNTLAVFLGVTGTGGAFTMAAAATLVVPNALVTAGSIILLTPTNAAAATLQGSNESLYISAKAAGVSFTVATAAGTSAAGTETFSYIIVNLTT